MVNIRKTIFFAIISSFTICHISYGESFVIRTINKDINVGPSVIFYNQATKIENNENIKDNIINDNNISTNSLVIPIIDDSPKIISSTEAISPTEVVYTHQGKKYKKGKSLGNFKLTGYCACTKCTPGTGYTYSGKHVTDNHTVSADLSIIPLNTFIILENTGGTELYKYDGVYQVEDKGGGVKNKHIDIYEATHEEALAVTSGGYKYADVYEAIEIE